MSNINKIRQFSGLKSKKKEKRKGMINAMNSLSERQRYRSKENSWEGHALVLSLGSMFGYSLYYLTIK